MFKRLMLLVGALAVLVGMGMMTTTAMASDITGDIDYRCMGWDNLDYNSDLDDDYSFSAMRSRFGFAGVVGGNAAYDFVLQNYTELGDGTNGINSLYKAVFTLNNFFIDGFSMTFGRTPLSYGNERVFGAEDWLLDVDPTYEGAFGHYAFDGGWVDVVKVKNAEGFDLTTDVTTHGFYMHYDAMENFYFEPYYLWTTFENADPDVDSDKNAVYGALFDYTMDALNFYGESIFQSSTVGDTDFSAMAYYFGVVYDFDMSVDPYIGFEYNVASGIADANEDMNYTPMGSTSAYLGVMGMVPWSDLTAMNFNGGFTPMPGLVMEFDYYTYEGNESGEAIGTELNAKADYELNEDINLELGLGIFTPDGDDVDGAMFAWFGTGFGF
ncbi:MAG: alginate export family protein [bacterium]|nr:alginate export family protein [bacterium]MCP4799338.1 alginate export family protein [bacterium]